MKYKGFKTSKLLWSKFEVSGDHCVLNPDSSFATEDPVQPHSHQAGHSHMECSASLSWTSGQYQKPIMGAGGTYWNEAPWGDKMALSYLQWFPESFSQTKFSKRISISTEHTNICLLFGKTIRYIKNSKTHTNIFHSSCPWVFGRPSYVYISTCIKTHTMWFSQKRNPSYSYLIT